MTVFPHLLSKHDQRLHLFRCAPAKFWFVRVSRTSPCDTTATIDFKGDDSSLAAVGTLCRMIENLANSKDPCKCSGPVGRPCSTHGIAYWPCKMGDSWCVFAITRQICIPLRQLPEPSRELSVWWHPKSDGCSSKVVCLVWWLAFPCSHDSGWVKTRARKWIALRAKVGGSSLVSC